jgi:hypothetical protein
MDVADCGNFGAELLVSLVGALEHFHRHFDATG